MNRRTVLLRAVAAAAAPFAWALAPAATSATADPIVVEAAWARASAGMTGAGAVFVTIRNTGEHADRLVGAAAPVARRAELHTHIVRDNVMRMRRVDAVPLRPGATTRLKPGGRHVMLMGLRAPLEEGARFPLTLVFEKAGALTVPVTVRAVAARGNGGMDDRRRK